MASQVLRKLEQKGLLPRDPDAVDTRARRIVATASGLALAPRAIEVVEAVDRAMLARLSPTGAHDFTSALRRLRTT